MKLVKLAIITDCVHMYDEYGKVATENHIFQRQIEALANQFEETLICCPFVLYTSDKVVSTYQNLSIRFFALPNVGGNGFSDKLKLLAALPAWLKAFGKASEFADIVYQRFPNNLNLPGLFYFYLRKKKVFSTYTGTWHNYNNEPVTYRLQKWLLKRLFRGPVFIYTNKMPPEEKLVKSFSPSFDVEEWLGEADQVANRLQRMQKKEMIQPVFVTVGSLQANKNQQFVLDVFQLLHQQKLNFQLFIVGDGPLRRGYEDFIRVHHLQDKVFITGKLKYEALKLLYRKADFVIQAPVAEGFGKVPVEGFCHGLVPLLSDTALAGEMTGNGKRGFIFKTDAVEPVALLIKAILAGEYDLSQMVIDGRAYAKELTIESWITQIGATIKRYYEH